VKHRKHASNASTTHSQEAMQREIALKTYTLQRILKAEVDEELVREFILITGRNLQNDQLYEKVMTSLKHR